VDRGSDLCRFYMLLDKLADLQGGPKPLADTIGSLARQSGVYFFFEPDEIRSQSGRGQRVVRVGTHGLKAGARSTLRQRLRQHAGTRSGGGNHRGSIYRLLVGDALLRSGQCSVCTSWANSKPDRDLERATEEAVSRHLANTTVLCLEVPDECGPYSLRGVVERNSIALLSNYAKPLLDPASSGWLGRLSSRERVRASGLWNQNHVDERYDPAFLGTLKHLIELQSS